MSEMCYVARRSCGCICGAIIDMPNHPKDVAKAVAGWIEAGLTIERASVDEVRVSFHSIESCPHQPKQLEMFQEGG